MFLTVSNDIKQVDTTCVCALQLKIAKTIMGGSSTDAHSENQIVVLANNLVTVVA